MAGTRDINVYFSYISLLNAGLRQVLKELMADKKSELLYYISGRYLHRLGKVSSLGASNCALHRDKITYCDAI